MIVGACGFGSTGSSVISDYLSEYQNSNIQVLDDIEFTWVSETDGLIDLQYHLMNPHNRTDGSIMAIHRYILHMQKNEKHYEKCGGIKKDVLRKSVYKFLNSITDVKWNWYIDDIEMGIFERLIKLSLLRGRVIPFIEKKRGSQIRCYPMQEVSLSMYPKDFDRKAKKHVRELLLAMGADLSKTIVLDQPFSGNNPQASFPFYDDPYAIVVDRDPRDNYIFAKTKLLGRNHFMAIDNVQDFVKYYRAIRDNQPYKKANPRVLSLKFENLVYDYDNTTAELRRFLRLPDNPNPKSIFDPSLSINNTQVFRRFPRYKKDIEYIEANLSDYLFDFSKYPEPDLNGEMFFGKSPLHK
ncbi:MAG: hypothetical protein IJ746_07165 [Ruminococcus sp.]|nr:hypothetical protein [Ruminococcus sp.]